MPSLSTAKRKPSPPRPQEKPLASNDGRSTRMVPAQAITVTRGISSGGFVVYGSPAQPRHFTLEQIARAVRALKTQ